jgi:hypothetical protein
MINQNGKWADSAARGFARMNHFSRCEKRNEYCQRKQMADCCGAMKFCRKKRSNSRIPFCLVPRISKPSCTMKQPLPHLALY